MTLVDSITTPSSSIPSSSILANLLTLGNNNHHYQKDYINHGIADMLDRQNFASNWEEAMTIIEKSWVSMAVMWSLLMLFCVIFGLGVLSVVAMSLPGYTLTGAMMELAVKNDLPVPSIWCMPLCIQSFWPLEWGTVIRCGTSPIIHNPPQQQHYLVVMLLLTHDGIFLCLPLDCLVGCLCFGANVQYQFHTYTLNAAVGFVVIYFLTPVVGSTSFFIASSAGAFALGLTGDLYAKMSHHTEFVPLFGGLVMLAPSGIWVRGAVSLFEGESTDNGNGMFTFQVIGIALSITLDFFLANLCVYPTGRK